MKVFLRVLIAGLFAVVATMARADTYPSRPIKLLVSFPPGGAADLVARIVGDPLSKILGAAVVIENRPGANGNIAGAEVARATPDGYTLLLGPGALFNINPHLYAKMPFDPLTQLEPVASIVANSLVLAANAKIAKDLDFRGFVELARKTKPPMFYGSIGLGSEHQLAMELLKQTAKIDLIHVPYKGGGPAGTAVLAGDISSMFGGGSVFPLVKSGKLKGMAVSGPKRIAELPDLPAIGEIYPGYDVTLWQGLFAPKGLPPEILAKIRSAAEKVRAMPEVAKHFASAGAGEPLLLSHADFVQRIKADNQKFGGIIKSLGLRVK